MGASLGLALGSEDDEEEYETMSDENYFRRAREAFLVYRGEEEEFDEDDYEEDDEIEIIERRKMTFVNQDGDEVEMVNTTEGFVEVAEPYIISEEEFEDPTVFVEFDRNTLIYYEGDDTLATDRDEVITDVESMVGASALTSFGCKSNNKDTVFVRNVRLGTNFEIIREEGSYTEIALGLPEEDIEYEKAKKFFKDLDDIRRKGIKECDV